MTLNQTLLYSDYDDRLQTFKVKKKWPFTKGHGIMCTAENMARSGFYRPDPIYSPDQARCFVCLKDLEGWEANDDPEAEHKSHQKECAFLKLDINRRDTTMKLNDFFQLYHANKTAVIIHKRDQECKRNEEKYEELRANSQLR